MKINFDWHSEKLTGSTKIDPGYKNTQNVRRFFKKEIGEHFHFNRPFMQYLKENAGITLKEAAEEWKRQTAK
jgi:Domain of unknown function (DUF6434)